MSSLSCPHSPHVSKTKFVKTFYTNLKNFAQKVLLNPIKQIVTLSPLIHPSTPNICHCVACGYKYKSIDQDDLIKFDEINYKQ